MSKVEKGIVRENFLIMLYGVEGVGKTTFGANTPNPIFICAERGSNHLDVSRLPGMDHWLMVMTAVNELLEEKHDYKTLVIDTVDWLERILHEYLCEQRNKSSIEDCGSYGKYVGVVNTEWKKLFDKLTKLRSKMNVLLLAHSEIKKFTDPVLNEEYDRYELKFYAKKSGALLKEYVDCVLFANHKTLVQKEDHTNKTRAYSDGERVVYTARRASHDAKNRFCMPDELPLDYEVIEKYLFMEPGHVVKDILELMQPLADDVKEKIQVSVDRYINDLRGLLDIKSRVCELTS